MDDLTLLVTALALAADAFAVGAGVAAVLPSLTSRHVFRLAWHFGLFQSLMTFFGWAGGEGLSTVMSGLNHWIASGILFVLGAKMIYESRNPADRPEDFDPTRGWSLMGLSIATSLDALAVGVTFSLIGISVGKPVLLIGLTALVMTFVGMKLGNRLGGILGQWAERAGGAVLIAIGAKILADFLGFWR